MHKPAGPGLKMPTMSETPLQWNSATSHGQLLQVAWLTGTEKLAVVLHAQESNVEVEALHAWLRHWGIVHIVFVNSRPKWSFPEALRTYFPAFGLGEVPSVSQRGLLLQEAARRPLRKPTISYLRQLAQNLLEESKDAYTLTLIALIRHHFKGILPQKMRILCSQASVLEQKYPAEKLGLFLSLTTHWLEIANTSAKQLLTEELSLETLRLKGLLGFVEHTLQKDLSVSQGLLERNKLHVVNLREDAGAANILLIDKALSSTPPYSPRFNLLVRKLVLQRYVFRSAEVAQALLAEWSFNETLRKNGYDAPSTKTLPVFLYRGYPSELFERLPEEKLILLLMPSVQELDGVAYLWWGRLLSFLHQHPQGQRQVMLAGELPMHFLHDERFMAFRQQLEHTFGYFKLLPDALAHHPEDPALPGEQRVLFLAHSKPQLAPEISCTVLSGTLQEKLHFFEAPDVASLSTQAWEKDPEDCAWFPPQKAPSPSPQEALPLPSIFRRYSRGEEALPETPTLVLNKRFFGAGHRLCFAFYGDAPLALRSLAGKAFPVRLRSLHDGLFLGRSGKVGNITQHFVDYQLFNYQSVFSAEHVAAYVFAMLHAPAYLAQPRRYVLPKQPLIPFPWENPKRFTKISNVGKSLLKTLTNWEAPESALQVRARFAVRDLHFTEDSLYFSDTFALPLPSHGPESLGLLQARGLALLDVWRTPQNEIALTPERLRFWQAYMNQEAEAFALYQKLEGLCKWV